MADSTLPSEEELAELERSAAVFTLPAVSGPHGHDWAVGPAPVHRGDHVSWEFSDLTEEQAKALAALLNAQRGLIAAARAVRRAEALADEMHAAAERAAASENERDDT